MKAEAESKEGPRTKTRGGPGIEGVELAAFIVVSEVAYTHQKRNFVCSPSI